MASLFDIGKSGLSSYREALSVTGQNIANINTDGYKRREANLEEIQGSSGGVNSVPDQSGLGVRVADVKRSYDEFLLNKARSTSSYAESSAAYSNNISDLEDVLLPGDHNLGSMIAEFFDGLQEVSVAPADRAPRTVALEQAGALTESFRQLALEMDAVKSGIVEQVDQAISDLNGLTSELANLNRAIGAGTAAKSNSALDARDALINKISDYVEITISDNEDGTKSLTLGNSGNGAQLVRHDRYSTLKSVDDGQNLSFLIGQGTGFVPTNQITSGSLKGLSDSYSKSSEMMGKIDNLAFKLVRDVNAIHEQGINLEGQPGEKFFMMADVSMIENPKNLGAAVSMVEVTDYTIVAPEYLEFSFDSKTDLWTGRNSSNQIVGSGKSQILLPGMRVEFSGSARQGDKFSLKPGEGSAKAIGLAITRAHDIAAAAKLLSSADPNNESAATMAVDALVIPPEDRIPDITKVMSDGLSAVAATTFYADGPAVVVPANVTDLDLVSLTQQSRVNFSLSDEKMKGINVASLKVTDQAGSVKTYSFDLSYGTFHSGASGSWNDMKKVADLLNQGVMKGTNDIDGTTKFSLTDIGAYASGSDGQLSISFSKSNIDNSASLSLSNSNSVAGVVTNRSDLGSNIQIFTREGRHIAGSSMTSGEISDLFTVTNGFNVGAKYVDTYLNKTGEDGYLGTTVSNKTDASDILTNISELGTSRTIRFDSLPNIDGNESSVNGTSASAETVDYSLTIDGLTKKLSSKDLVENDAESVAVAMAKKFRSNAPIANLTGQSALTKTNTIVLSEGKRTAFASNGSLNLNFEDITYQLNELPDGTVNIVSSNPQNTLSLSYDPSSYTITETITTFPENDDKVVVSFEGQNYSIIMRQGEVYVSGGESGRLSASFNKDHKLHIWSNDGTLISDNITLPTSASVDGNTEAAARFGLTNGTSQPIAALTQQSIPLTVTETISGASSTYEVQTVSGLTSNALSSLAEKTLTIGDTAFNLRVFEHDLNVTTEGISGVNEVQSINGFDYAGLNNLAGQTVTLSDGATTISHKFTTAPVSVASVISSLQSATGYSSLAFNLSAGNDALTLTYKATGAAASATFTQSTSAVTVSFDDEPTLSDVVLALQSHSGYSNLDFTVAAGTDSLVLTYKSHGAVTTTAVSEIESFYDRDFNIRVDGQNIIATHNDSSKDLQASATADSLIGQRITLSDMPDEELIVVLTGQASRKISANYDLRPPEAPVITRDLTIQVTDVENGVVEFVDTETGTSMATRSLTSRKEAIAKGFDIKLSGDIQLNDKFHIATNYEGVGDGRNLEAIISLQATNDNNPDIGGFQEIFGSMVATLGTSVRTSKLTLEAAETLRDAAVEAEASYSGVNLDTEASKLIEQQQAYQASARILSTARELFQTLLQSI